MNIEGLDYNTQREKLVMPEYGRGVQKMVDYAISLPTREERQQCAETIISIMNRMTPQGGGDKKAREQKLWDHLALMSNFQLDINYPYDVTEAKQIAEKPAPMGYPMRKIPVRHYGSMVFGLFEQLKTMAPGEERDALVCLTANQMKRSLLQWSHGSADDAKVAADLERFTDGAIRLDLSTFKFEKINEREFSDNRKKKR